MRRRPLSAVVALLAAGLLTGCAAAGPGAASPTASSTPAGGFGFVTATPGPSVKGAITVDAASSLSGVLPKLAAAFQAEHPGSRVRLNFGGSSDLAAAIVAGAPVDVFLAASRKTMSTVTDADLAGTAPVAIAGNMLAIAVPRGNPARISGLKDFGDVRRTIVMCAPAVPCGAAAQRVFALAKVTPKPDSLEQSVTGVLTKVRLGEADAGLVYATDVLAAQPAVEPVPFPEATKVVTEVLIAPLAHAPNPALARAFTSYVVQQGGPALSAAGFLGVAR